MCQVCIKLFHTSWELYSHKGISQASTVWSDLQSNSSGKTWWETESDPNPILLGKIPPLEHKGISPFYPIGSPISTKCVIVIQQTYDCQYFKQCQSVSLEFIQHYKPKCLSVSKSFKIIQCIENECKQGLGIWQTLDNSYYIPRGPHWFICTPSKLWNSWGLAETKANKD